MIGEIDLLSILGTRDGFEKYKGMVENHALTEQTQTILKDLGIYYKTFSVDEVDWEQFSTWFRVNRHGRDKPEKLEPYKQIFDRLKDHEPDEQTEAIVNRFVEIGYAGKLLDVSARVVDGLDSLDSAVRIVDEWQTRQPVGEDSFVDSDIKKVLDRVVRKGGIEWRLEDLNVCVGPLHVGDLVVVAGYTEVGKTTFVTSEVTYFASQVERPILFLNNEEDGDKIVLRLYQSALNKTVAEIQHDDALAKSEYDSIVEGRILVYDDAGLSVSRVEQIVRELNPQVIVFNVLDKVEGFSKESANEVDRQRRLAQWARGLAKRHGIVIDVAQADGSTEGQKWVYKNQLYGSKVGVPAEADAIITIGQTDEEQTRYIHVPKNKLPGGPRSDESQRHGYIECRFDGSRGRYETIKYRS